MKINLNSFKAIHLAGLKFSLKNDYDLYFIFSFLIFAVIFSFFQNIYTILLFIFLFWAQSVILKRHQNRYIKTASSPDRNIKIYQDNYSFQRLIAVTYILIFYFNQSSSSIIVSFLIIASIIVSLYFSLANLRLFNAHPLFEINDFGVLAHKYWFIKNLKLKVNEKKYKYIFVPWSYIENVDFLQVNGKKLAIQTPIALWGNQYIEGFDYIKNKQCWHAITSKYTLILPIYFFNSVAWNDITLILESKIKNNKPTYPQLMNEAEQKILDSRVTKLLTN